jgi:hypothetical protein
MRNQCAEEFKNMNDEERTAYYDEDKQMTQVGN